MRKKEADEKNKQDEMKKKQEEDKKEGKDAVGKNSTVPTLY